MAFAEAMTVVLPRYYADELIVLIYEQPGVFFCPTNTQTLTNEQWHVLFLYVPVVAAADEGGLDCLVLLFYYLLRFVFLSFLPPIYVFSPPPFVILTPFHW